MIDNSEEWIVKVGVLLKGSIVFCVDVKVFEKCFNLCNGNV